MFLRDFSCSNYFNQICNASRRGSIGRYLVECFGDHTPSTHSEVCLGRYRLAALLPLHLSHSAQMALTAFQAAALGEYASRKTPPEDESLEKGSKSTTPGSGIPDGRRRREEPQRPSHRAHCRISMSCSRPPRGPQSLRQTKSYLITSEIFDNTRDGRRRLTKSTRVRACKPFMVIADGYITAISEVLWSFSAGCRA